MMTTIKHRRVVLSLLFLSLLLSVPPSQCDPLIYTTVDLIKNTYIYNSNKYQHPRNRNRKSPSLVLQHRKHISRLRRRIWYASTVHLLVQIHKYTTKIPRILRNNICQIILTTVIILASQAYDRFITYPYLYSYNTTNGRNITTQTNITQATCTLAINTMLTLSLPIPRVYKSLAILLVLTTQTTAMPQVNTVQNTSTLTSAATLISSLWYHKLSTDEQRTSSTHNLESIQGDIDGQPTLPTDSKNIIVTTQNMRGGIQHYHKWKCASELVHKKQTDLAILRDWSWQ